MRPRLNCISGWQGRIKGGTWVHQARIVERATMLTRFVRYRAVIASGAPWCVAGISAGLTRRSENNAQATRAESAQTVLIKTAQATRRLTASLRSVSVGASRPVVSSKHENFGEGLCVRWRQLDRGMPGGGSECCGLHVEPPIPGPAKARCGCSEEAWLVPLTSTLSAKPLRTPSLSSYKR